MLRIFDRLFIDQLLGRAESGETIYFPNGRGARGYLVPPDREAHVRARLRRLVLAAWVGTIVFVVIVPRSVEWWFGFTIPIKWFIGGVLVAFLAAFAAIVRALWRLTDGLAPAGP